MNENDIKALANVDFKSEAWIALYNENPEAADALRYVLLMEKFGGRGVDGKPTDIGEVSRKVADELGISLTTLAVNRRKWTKSGVLAQARAMLEPLHAEQDALLADMVLSAKSEVVRRIMAKMFDKEATFYQLINGWDFLKREVL